MTYCVHTTIFDDGKVEASLYKTENRRISIESHKFFDTYEEALAAMPSGKAAKLAETAKELKGKKRTKTDI